VKSLTDGKTRSFYKSLPRIFFLATHVEAEVAEAEVGKEAAEAGKGAAEVVLRVVLKGVLAAVLEVVLAVVQLGDRVVVALAMGGPEAVYRLGQVCEASFRRFQFPYPLLGSRQRTRCFFIWYRRR
jgi:hypothetical protein